MTHYKIIARDLDYRANARPMSQRCAQF